MGNRTQESSYIAGGSTPTKIHGRRFDALNRLSQQLNAAGQVVAQYGYDGNGNLKQTTTKPDNTGTHDQLSVYTYDALNRLASGARPGAENHRVCQRSRQQSHPGHGCAHAQHNLRLRWAERSRSAR